MLLVISMKELCCSCCTQPLHCHFGWSHWHRPTLVINGYSGYGTTPKQQQQQQWRTNNSGRTQNEFNTILFLSCCGGQLDICGSWRCQRLAINLGGISLVPAAATGQGPFKWQQQRELYICQFLMEDETTPESFQPPRVSCCGQGGIMSCCHRRLLQQSWKFHIYLSGSVGYTTGHCLESSQFDHSAAMWLLHGHLV